MSQTPIAIMYAPRSGYFIGWPFRSIRFGAVATHECTNCAVVKERNIKLNKKSEKNGLRAAPKPKKNKIEIENEMKGRETQFCERIKLNPFDDLLQKTIHIYICI